MAKDPAFLMYSKDWLEGTAEMLPDEKGVYIDLLCHQHQKGSLPIDLERLCRMVGMDVVSFVKIWDHISSKFENINNRLVNRKLSEVSTERLDKSYRNKITGTFASLLRLSKCDAKTCKLIKESFNVDDFTEIPTERLTICLTDWFNVCLKSIANANEDIITSNNKTIPDENEFLNYCNEQLKEKYPALIFSLKSKYRSWVENDWKDGYDKKIKNWKTKILNTMPYLKPEQNGQSAQIVRSSIPTAPPKDMPVPQKYIDLANGK